MEHSPDRVGLFIVAACLRTDTTFTFQNSVNGYSGAKDVAINTQYPQYNGGNGVLWRGDPELGCCTTTGRGAYTVRYLLKFGAPTAPAGIQSGLRELDDLTRFVPSTQRQHHRILLEQRLERGFRPDRLAPSKRQSGLGIGRRFRPRVSIPWPARAFAFPRCAPSARRP
jgi:hypothetical protein